MVVLVMKRVIVIEYYNLFFYSEFILDLVYRYLIQFVNIVSLCLCLLNFILKFRDILLWKFFVKFFVDEREKVRFVIFKIQFQLFGKFFVELNVIVFSNKDFF